MAVQQTKNWHRCLSHDRAAEASAKAFSSGRDSLGPSTVLMLLFPWYLPPEDSVKIAIDARKWNDYGIGTYVRNVVRHLARFDHETTYLLFCNPADEPTLRDLAENFVPVVDGSARYGLREHFSIPLKLRRLGADLLHSRMTSGRSCARCRRWSRSTTASTSFFRSTCPAGWRFSATRAS